MAGERALSLGYPFAHCVARSITFTDDGSTLDIGDIPPCTIQEIKIAKTVDFDAGTNNQLDIGIKYSDGTTADPDAFVSNADLSSSTALGPLTATLVNSAAFKVGVDATITCTVDLTGTAATAGAAEVFVYFVPTETVR
ncbi:MAG: hypothetical protein AAFR11_05605 [Pseudomonadota bacterium]